MNNDEDQLSYSHSTDMKSSFDDKSSTDTIFPDRRRVRVKFAYIIDNDRVLPITQNTQIRSEPYFHITATEDQPTKQFYRNPPHRITRSRLPTTPDSLEEEKNSHWNEREIDRTRSSSPIKSILKKPLRKKEENRSRSSSPSKRERSSSSSSRLDYNEVQHLAEMTAKQTPTQPSSIYCRSLFDQTMNIFDPDNSYYIQLNNPRPSRLEYYIKPYRGEANPPSKRSRSLGHQSQTKTTRPVTNRQSYRKQHVSWSPVRQYIHQGRDSTRRTIPEKKENFSSGSFPPSMNIPPNISPPSSVDSYHSLSHTDEEIDRRDERLERYDRLLEKMRVTDEELQSLSRSWTNKSEEKVPIKFDRSTSSWFNRLIIPEDYFSPMILQMCLILLVIFNLLVLYFFNDINLWWNEYISPIIVQEQYNEDTL